MFPLMVSLSNHERTSGCRNWAPPPLYNGLVADRSQVLQVAQEIIRQVQREFPDASLELDWDHPRQEHEDVYLWVSIPQADDDDEEVGDLWGFVIHLVQRAFQEDDVYLTARMRGRTVIRDRSSDKE